MTSGVGAEAGKAGFLSEAERDDMGTFLLNVPFPPAQKRPYTNELTARARRGFELFHVLGDDDPSKSQPNICGDCHRMPYLVSTNTPGTGMDAPTWRGAPRGDARLGAARGHARPQALRHAPGVRSDGLNV